MAYSKLEKPNIEDVLEKEGIILTGIKDGFKCCCPIHRERAPSCYINVSRQAFHCFGCGERGDVVTLIMKMRGIDFKDAISYLGIEPGKTYVPDPAELARKEAARVRVSSIAKWKTLLGDMYRTLHGERSEARQRVLTMMSGHLTACLTDPLPTIEYWLSILDGKDAEEIDALLADLTRYPLEEWYQEDLVSFTREEFRRAAEWRRNGTLPIGK